MLKKFITVLSVVAMVTLAFSTSISANGISYGEKEDSIDWNSNSENVVVNPGDNVVDKEQIELAENLSKYFEEDTDGNVKFTADKETLMKMGISESDAELMTSISLDALSVNEGEQQLQGFVGLHFNIGKNTRNMSAVAAGAFAAGYIGYYTARIAAAGPWGAAAAATITATTAFVVGNAVRKNLKRVNVGVNIPFVSLSYTVNLP